MSIYIDEFGSDRNLSRTPRRWHVLNMYGLVWRERIEEQRYLSILCIDVKYMMIVV